MQHSYWGKTFDEGKWHHLGHHCLDVAAVAERLLESNPVWQARMEGLSPIPPAQTRSLILFLAACHDLGKFYPGFQKISPIGAELGHTRGETCSHHTENGLGIWDELQPESFLDLPDFYSLESLLTAALCHHGVPRKAHSPDSFTSSVAADIKLFLREIAAHFLRDSYADWREVDLKPLSWFVAGLMILADWVGSNERWFTPVSRWEGVAAYWPVARERAGKAVAALELAEVGPRKDGGFGDVLPHLKESSPSFMQQAVLDLPQASGPELMIVEDLTGGGKTEAALLAAHRLMRGGQAAGLFIGLPTMATANAMYERLAGAYRMLFRVPDVFLALAHGNTFLNETYLASIGRDEEEGGEAGHVASRWLADSRKKALLAPCGVGTIDQALLGVLAAKHQSLRLLGLCRSVLVVDEVHSYDTYTGELLANLLRFHGALGGSAVLLSATMTGGLRERMADAWREGRKLAGASVAEPMEVPEPLAAPFPLLTRLTDVGGESLAVPTARRLRVKVDPVYEESAMFDGLCHAAEAGGCVCWIRNTVTDVLEAARVLIEDRNIPANRITVFHSRFTGGDRAGIERKVMQVCGKESVAARRAGQIVIGSQVIEQSLDLDFDILFTDLAPMDLMIQRAGRCHRHDRKRPPLLREAVMRVLMPDPADNVPADWYGAMFEKGRGVYRRPAVLWRTARLLRDKGAIVLPEDARELVEGAYADGVVHAPKTLDQQEMEAEAEACAALSAARFGMLPFYGGYAMEGCGWDEDIIVPTRLGEETRNVRLLRVCGEEVRLWHGDGKRAAMDNCIRSEVRVAAYLLAEAHVHESCRDAVEALIKTMRDKGKWCLCLPMRETAPGQWAGRGKDARGRAVTVRYNDQIGLVVD